MLLTPDMAFFSPMCICFFYLKCIFHIFENVKKLQTKILCVHLHVLGAYEVVLRKNDFFFCGLCKNDKIWY
jgi:hypothetical protein